MIISAKLMIIS